MIVKFNCNRFFIINSPFEKYIGMCKSSAYKPELLNYLKISSILKDFLACVPLENDRKNSIVGGKPIFI